MMCRFSTAIGEGLELVFEADATRNRPGPYPSGALSKGLLLRSARVGDLSQEGVGFGVPVLKTGITSIFPGQARVIKADQESGRLTVEYEMCLVDRLMRAGNVVGGLVDRAKEIAAAVHRRVPFTRGFLSRLSTAVRAAGGLTTSFVPCASAGCVRVDYEAAPVLNVSVDAAGVSAKGLTQIVVMNELGADYFSRYIDSEGNLLDGEAIGTWSRVDARQASFMDPVHDIAFSVGGIKGAELFRGRERVAERLAWAGFGCVLPASERTFSYDVRITPPGAQQWPEFS